ncbi:MAG: queuosine precursor transporter [bacterium]|nr:queuosine precursor transporter [bacterium]
MEKKIKRQESFSATFLLLAVSFVVCLISSNLFASKIFSLYGFTLSGAVIIFPISYIINDALTEIYGYRKARLTIWMGFLLNLLFVLAAQLVMLLPGAPFWEGEEAFSTVFSSTPRALMASLLAFLVGANANAIIMSKMKVSNSGKNFSARAILSSIAGETMDSLIFVPVMFWFLPWMEMGKLMLGQIVIKVTYEIVILPITKLVIKRIKSMEGEDVYDYGISYNPFKLTDY